MKTREECHIPGSPTLDSMSHVPGGFYQWMIEDHVVSWLGPTLDA